MTESEEWIFMTDDRIHAGIIEEAIRFYDLPQGYEERGRHCLEQIGQREEWRTAVADVYRRLYTGAFTQVKELWPYKDAQSLFGDGVDPFVTSMMILLGCGVHRENMERYSFDAEQIRIHKARVRGCIEGGGMTGAKPSQMVWAAHFIRAKILEIGSLQFEYDTGTAVKIHIPQRTDLSPEKVADAIRRSRLAIKRTFGADDTQYLCNTWLLSNQIRDIVGDDSRIARFHEQFDVTDGGDCTGNILTYVYGLGGCEDYALLPENTSLQRRIKERLLQGGTFYMGMGVLKSGEPV